MAVAYSARSVVVGNGDGSAVFTVQRTGTSDVLAETSSVNFATEDVTAKQGTDYVATAGSLSFAPGAVTQEVQVSIIADPSQSDSTRTFLLVLEGFGAATASISGDSDSTDTQVYWLVPGDGEKVTVPTSSTAGAWAKAQMDVSKFSDPTSADKIEAVPHTYMRLGHARADMNPAERVIAESRGFFATDPVGEPGDGMQDLTQLSPDGTPREPGATLEYMKPRNVNRERRGWQDKMSGNAHLDGIFLYTQGHMTTSALGSATYVVKSDYSLYVGGETRYTYMGDVTTAYLSPNDGIFRFAQGAQVVDGDYIDYEIKGLRSLEVVMEDSVKYATSAEFAVNTALQIDVFTGAKYEVKNALNMEVSGLEVSAKCDVLGNYEIEYMAGDVSSTKSESSLSASEKIVLQVDPVGAASRKLAVQAFTGTNLALAAAAGITAAVPFGASQTGLEDSFANSVSMEGNLARLMNAGYPASFATLAGIGAAMAIGVVAAQAIEEEVPNLMPKISMNPAELSLSVGPTSLTLTAAGLNVVAPRIGLASAGMFQVESSLISYIAAEQLTYGAPSMDIVGNTNYVGNFELTGMLNVAGVVTAMNIEADI